MFSAQLIYIFQTKPSDLLELSIIVTDNNQKDTGSIAPMIFPEGNSMKLRSIDPWLEEEWAKLMDPEAGYVDLIYARELLLMLYPPFMQDWFDAQNESKDHDCFIADDASEQKSGQEIEPAIIQRPVDIFVDKWEVFIDWHRCQMERSKLPIFLKAKPSISLIQPSSSALSDGLWLHSQPEDALLFQINVNAPLQTINKFIESMIRKKTGKVAKLKDSIILDIADIHIWAVHVQGFEYNSPEMIETYNKYNQNPLSAEIIADRLRSKKGRLHKLRRFVDPERHGG